MDIWVSQVLNIILIRNELSFYCIPIFPDCKFVMPGDSCSDEKNIAEFSLLATICMPYANLETLYDHCTTRALVVQELRVSVAQLAFCVYTEYQ